MYLPEFDHEFEYVKVVLLAEQDKNNHGPHPDPSVDLDEWPDWL